MKHPVFEQPDRGDKSLSGGRRSQRADPFTASFETTYPRYPFSELVRLSLAVAARLARLRAGRSHRNFGVRRLTPKPPGDGQTKSVAPPGGPGPAVPYFTDQRRSS